MPFMLIGIAMIIAGVLINVLMQFPATSLAITAVFGAVIADSLNWIASSLEIIVPIGIFLIAWKFVGPLIAGVASIVIGLVMWGVLLL